MRNCNLYINVKEMTNCISTSKQINIKTTLKFNVETTMILGWDWNQFCSVIPTDSTGWINLKISSTRQYRQISTSFWHAVLIQFGWGNNRRHFNVYFWYNFNAWIIDATSACFFCFFKKKTKNHGRFSATYW